MSGRVTVNLDQGGTYRVRAGGGPRGGGQVPVVTTKDLAEVIEDLAISLGVEDSISEALEKLGERY